MSEKPWVYWVWEQPSWRVMSRHETYAEAAAVARHACDPPDTYCICLEDSTRDRRLRADCTNRMALHRPQ